jgi:perosamine synthetase
MNIVEPYFDDEEIRLVQQCLNSKWVTQGPMVAEFEKRFAQRHQVTHAMATTSCTAALHLAVLALELAPGDEVVVPAFTWVTSAHCAEYVGAKAVFADIDPATYNFDPAAVEAAISHRTKAIVAVHLFGLSAPMDELLALARKHHLTIIEDAACAIGTTYRGRPVGAIGDIGCFSFHPRKVITTGEGGMVTTDNKDVADRVRSLRNHGSTGTPSPDSEAHGPWTMATFNRLGFNLRLSDIQAAVGVAQMDKLEGLLVERLRIAKHYHELLSGVEELALPMATEKCSHTYQSYVVRLLKGGITKRNALMEHLYARGIQTRPGTHAVHRLGYYAQKYGLRPEDFPIASTCWDLTVTLPLFRGMTEQNQRLVTESLKEFFTNSWSERSEGRK